MMLLDIHTKIALILILGFLFISTFTMPDIYELMLKLVIVLGLVVNGVVQFLKKNKI